MNKTNALTDTLVDALKKVGPKLSSAADTVKTGAGAVANEVVEAATLSKTRGAFKDVQESERYLINQLWKDKKSPKAALMDLLKASGREGAVIGGVGAAAATPFFINGARKKKRNKLAEKNIQELQQDIGMDKEQSESILLKEAHIRILTKRAGENLDKAEAISNNMKEERKELKGIKKQTKKDKKAGVNGATRKEKRKVKKIEKKNRKRVSPGGMFTAGAVTAAGAGGAVVGAGGYLTYKGIRKLVSKLT